MSITKEQVIEALRSAAVGDGGVPLPPGTVRSVGVCDNHVLVRLAVAGSGQSPQAQRLGALVRTAIERRAAETGSPVTIALDFVEAAVPANTAEAPGEQPSAGHRPIHGLGPSRPPTPQGAAQPLPDVKHTVAVGAGKGGVGKSTVALNLAVGLARKGHAVGLMDGDIYGPSIPTLLNLHAHQTAVLQGKLQPFYVHGIKAMTIGKLVDPEKPLIWRGPMAHGAFKQLAEQTHWGELDYLVIDLPPGTGDVPLTMAQMLQLTGAVVVCTPQKVAQDDAVRATRMFQQLGIEVLGVVENMSVFVGDDGKEYDIFGRGGAEAMAQRLNVPFLGALPLTMALRKNSDSGDPTANFTAPGALGNSLLKLVDAVESQVALAAMRQGRSRPTLTIS